VARATKSVLHDMMCRWPQRLLKAVGDVVGGAVGDQGVDELVAAGRGEVGVGETQPLEVVHVVREVAVVVRVQDRRPRTPPRRRGSAALCARAAAVLTTSVRRSIEPRG